MQPDAGELLADLVETIYSNLDLREVLQVVTDTGTRLAGAEFGAFFYNATDDHGNAYRLHVLSGAAAEEFVSLPSPRITGLFEPTFRGERIIRSHDIRHDARFSGMPEGHLSLRSYLAVPVVSRASEVVGALLFGHREAGVFDQRSETLMARIAVHAAAAVENARLFEAEQAARRDAEESAHRLTVLQEVTSRLASARVPADVTDAVLDSLRGPLGADRIGVYVPADHHFAVLYGHRGAAGPASPELATLPRDWESPIADAYLTGEPVVTASPDEFARRYPTLSRNLSGVKANLSLPLVTRAGPVGALTLTWDLPRPISDADIGLLQAVARHVAAALERTRLYEAEAAAQQRLREYADQVTETSLTLQRSLLPRTLPTHPQLAAAVRYQPATSTAEVGGDWYDVVDTPEGNIVYVIGDVEGHSMSAAAVMGQLRIAMRAYLSEGHTLDEAISRVNQLFLSLVDNMLATCCMVQVNPATGEADVIRAGHQPPLILTAGGEVSEVEVDAGIPLGVLPEAAWTVTTLRIPAGARVLLYTDGLVERRDRDIDACITDLTEVARQGRHLDASGAADLILDRLGMPRRDDIALLIFDYLGLTPGQVKPPGSERRGDARALAEATEATEAPGEVVSVVPLVPSARRQPPPAELVLSDIGQVRQARAAAKEWLSRWELGPLEDTVTLLVSEMATNALVHAPGPATLSMRRLEYGVRISVVDREPTVPYPRQAEDDELSGRGLMIVEALANAWGVEPTGDGKAVWADVFA